MADTGKIYIYVTNQAPKPGEGSSDSEKNENEKDVLTHYALNRLQSLGKEVVNSAAKVYVAQPSWNGDYVTQAERENLLNAINIGMKYGTAFISGTIATGNPIGGLIALGIQGASDLISLGFRYKQVQLTSIRVNSSIELNRKRSGLDTLTNGGRGTRD